MKETQEDLEVLQGLLNQSIERAGSFLRSSFEMPEHSLSAAQLVHYLQGLQNVVFATITAKGEPRVAPIGSLFYRGHFYLPTVATAARTKHVMKRPAVSLTYYEGIEMAIIVHGYAEVIHPDHPDFEILEELQKEYTNHSVREWGEGVYLQIKEETIYTYARNPGDYPED